MKSLFGGYTASGMQINSNKSCFEIFVALELKSLDNRLIVTRVVLKYIAVWNYVNGLSRLIVTRVVLKLMDHCTYYYKQY